MLDIVNVLMTNQLLHPIVSILPRTESSIAVMDAPYLLALQQSCNVWIQIKVTGFAKTDLICHFYFEKY